MEVEEYDILLRMNGAKREETTSTEIFHDLTF